MTRSQEGNKHNQMLIPLLLVLFMIVRYLRKYKKYLFTAEEIQFYNSKESCWIVIDSMVYDVTDYLSIHPGGSFLILTYAGKCDTIVTTAFNTFHKSKSSSLSKVMNKYFIGYCFDSTATPINNTIERSSELAHDQFVQFVKQPSYPCVCARSTLYLNKYKFKYYDSKVNIKNNTLASDLSNFLLEQAEIWKSSNNKDRMLTTFVACFKQEEFSEQQFEFDLFTQLEHLHSLDNHDYSNKKNTTIFPHSFNFGGRSFFIAGLHSNSSRRARRFTYPTLVFNALDQFEMMEESYSEIHRMNCKRESVFDWDNNYNPMIDLIPRLGACVAFSGRQIDPETWTCPKWWLRMDPIDTSAQNNKDIGQLKELAPVKRALTRLNQKHGIQSAP
jgi:FPC/CPF motif-containing protein YcgG/predicted heme/steroid binding protein